MQSWVLVLMWGIVCLNGVTFACAFWDKWAAVRKGRRLPEGLFLWMAFLGGSLGARLAQMVFHWKVLDRTFSNTLTMICLLQMAILANIVALRHVDREAVAAALSREEKPPPGPKRFGPGA